MNPESEEQFLSNAVASQPGEVQKALFGHAETQAGFMEGYAMGMAHAHQQALGHVRNAGALSMRVKQTEQEQLRTSNRVRSLELTMALGTGGVVQRLRNLDERMLSSEQSHMRDSTQLGIIEHRLRECERRTESLLLPLVRCAWSGFRAAADIVNHEFTVRHKALLCFAAGRHPFVLVVLRSWSETDIRAGCCSMGIGGGFELAPRGEDGDDAAAAGAGVALPPLPPPLRPRSPPPLAPQAAPTNPAASTQQRRTSTGRRIIIAPIVSP